VTTSRLRSLAGLGLAATVLLTGCGASGWNPGVGVRVADESISLNEVQDTATSYCSAVETQLEEGTAVANSVVGSQVAGSLALRTAAEQWAASVGVEPAEDYDIAADSLDRALAGLSEDQQEAVRAVNLAQPYVDSVTLAYGQEEVGDSDKQVEAARAAGQEAFAAWLDDQDVQVDPRYSVTLEDGAIARADTQVSYPVSETAESVASGEPDADYANDLAPDQRCGG
jgi:hypothetical protein